MKYFVNRQRRWDTGEEYVEIAKGGSDYANADMLVDKYRHLGEGQTFNDPRKAVKAAIEIKEQWKKDSKDDRIYVAIGFTHGFSIPFEETTDEEVIEKAEKEYQKLPKCDVCSELLEEDDHYYHFEFPEFKFCSEYCVDTFDRDNFDFDSYWHEDED